MGRITDLGVELCHCITVRLLNDKLAALQVIMSLYSKRYSLLLLVIESILYEAGR